MLAMPNTTPATDSGEVVRYILDKAMDADANVYVAASITKGLKSLEPTDIEELKNAGAIALTDDGRPVENTKFLSDAMKKLRFTVCTLLLTARICTLQTEEKSTRARFPKARSKGNPCSG